MNTYWPRRGCCAWRGLSGHARPRHHLGAGQSGFALVEIAIAMVILGLLLGTGLTLVRSQTEQTKIRETQKLLEDAKEALIGYAATQTPPHLPCPDKTTEAGAGTRNDGLEDFTLATGVCVSNEGNLPWATLGVGDADGWGHRLHYSVTPIFSNRAPAATVSLTSGGGLRVCQDANCAAILANAVPAVLLSYGPNGLGAITAAGTAMPVALSADEIENTDQDADFVYRSPRAATAPLGEFDDLVTWLPPGLFFARLIQAGKL